MTEQTKKISVPFYVFVGILLAIVAAILFYNAISKRNHMEEEAKKGSAPHDPIVRVVKPFLAPDTAILFLPGTIKGFRETNLYARVNGYVKNWYVDIGDLVKEGQLLAELETPELDQQLTQSRASMDLAKSSLDRVNSVTIEGAVSAQQKADRDGTYRTTAAQVSQLEAQKSFKRVVAPFSGTITSRNIDIGTLVNAGSSVSQQLFTIAQTSRLRIFVYVPQSFVRNISIGTEAEIFVQEISAKSITGRVTRTAGALNPDTRTMLVQVEFENPGQLYLPGMYAKVEFVVKRSVRTLMIPANTLIIRNEGPQVVTVTTDNIIALKKVIIGKDNGATLEISSGLKGDEQLVTNASLDLSEGLKVAIAQTPVKK